MSNDDPLKNWQLENRGETLDRWKLQDTEQDLSKHMQLQPATGAGPDWQPIEYVREEKRRRTNWVLPSIVIVALVAVLCYAGWLALNRFGGASRLPVIGSLLPATGAQPAAPTPPAAATPVAGAAAAVTAAPPATPTVAPSPTAVSTAAASPLPPSPVPSLVTLYRGTVNAPDGVNARKEPSTAADVVKLLAKDEKVTVVDRRGDWSQVLLADNRTGWVTTSFLNLAAEELPLSEFNKIRVAAALPALAAEQAAAIGAGMTPAAASSMTSTAGAAVTPTLGPAPMVSLTLTVIGEPFVNARQRPAAEADVITTLPVSASVAAVGRTEDRQWLVVTLPDAKQGWVAAQFLAGTGDLGTLTVIAPDALAAQSEAGTRTAAGAQAPVALAKPLIVPPAPFTNTVPATGAALAVSDTVGVNARSAPTTTANVVIVVPNGAVLAVTGRSADGSWLRVALPDGAQGWMAKAAVAETANIDVTPVIESEAPAATAPLTTTAEQPPAAPTAAPTAGLPAAVVAKATISNPIGANLRPTPDQNTDPIATARGGDVFDVLGRSEDSQWIQVRQADGASAWLRINTVTLDKALDALPVVP